MNAKIFSLSWQNIPPEILDAQRSVFDFIGLPISQHRIHGFDHGAWIDWVMEREEEADVVCFLDADCIPLSKEAMLAGIQKAASGTLYGAEGAANHLDPTRSYAGAWFLFVNRKLWAQMNKPSAKATPYTDVAQMWTAFWQGHKLPVELIAPTACETPKWDLPGRKGAYGLATTYGDACFHLFESRSGHADLFVRRCEALVKGPAS